jgi:hypothetical protein
VELIGTQVVVLAAEVKLDNLQQLELLETAEAEQVHIAQLEQTELPTQAVAQVEELLPQTQLTAVQVL